jgi:hypothetical protein
MKILKWLAIALAGVVLFVGVVLIGARFADGPVGILPGGAFVSGDLYEGPEPDWSSMRDLEEIEMQLLEPTRSRRMWVAVHDGRLFIASGFMNTPVGRILKQWPREADEDGRAVLRVDGKLYERSIVRIHDRPSLEGIAAEVSRKYDMTLTPEMDATGDAWFFELKPRQPHS